MIFLNNAQLTFFIKKYPFNVMLMLIIMLLVIILLSLIKYKNQSCDYKIYNFKLNALFIGIYFSFFFALIIYIRIIRWGFTLNLAKILLQISIIIKGINILFIIIVFLFCCIAFVLLIKIKSFFTREIIKRHLYLYFHKMYNNLLEHIERKKNIESDFVFYDLYIVITRKLAGIYSYNIIISNAIYNNLILPYSIITEKDIYPFWMGKPLQKVLLLMHKIVLVLIIFYECFYHNWTLHVIFFYLPFYFLITMYKKITLFLSETNEQLNNIIYERYYEENNVLYVNTTEEEDQYIIKYIANNFKCFSHNVVTWQEKNFFLHFADLFIIRKRFAKTNIPFIFQNKQGEQIDSRQIILEKIYT